MSSAIPRTCTRVIQGGDRRGTLPLCGLATGLGAQNWQGTVCSSKCICCDIQVRRSVFPRRKTRILQKRTCRCSYNRSLGPPGIVACVCLSRSAFRCPNYLLTHIQQSPTPCTCYDTPHTLSSALHDASQPAILCLADGDALTAGRLGYHAWLEAGAAVRARSAPVRAGGSAPGSAMHVQRGRLQCAAPGAPPTAAQCPPDAPCLPPRRRCLSTC